MFAFFFAVINLDNCDTIAGVTVRGVLELMVMVVVVVMVTGMVVVVFVVE